MRVRQKERAPARTPNSELRTPNSELRGRPRVLKDTFNDEGWAEFPCPAGSVSVWVPKS